MKKTIVYNADIMALAIGVNALPGIVKTIAAGLTERWKTVNFKPLNIIICENILNAKQFFEELIIQKLTTDKLQIFRETTLFSPKKCLQQPTETKNDSFPKFHNTAYSHCLLHKQKIFCVLLRSTDFSLPPFSPFPIF